VLTSEPRRCTCQTWRQQLLGAVEQHQCLLLQCLLLQCLLLQWLLLHAKLYRQLLGVL
jgi:hypothetical protein